MIDKTLIIKRFKEIKNIKKDKDLADYLGISTPTLTNWKRRNTIDFDTLFSKCHDISLNWLIFGEGERLKHNSNATIENKQEGQNINKNYGNATYMSEPKAKYEPNNIAIATQQDTIKALQDTVRSLQDTIRALQDTIELQKDLIKELRK